MSLVTTDEMIESIAAVAGDDVRARHFLRESLRNLVRLAKLEKAIEVNPGISAPATVNGQTLH